VTIERAREEVPARIVGVRRGVLAVERTETLRTRYAVDAGAHTPGTLYLRHVGAAGFSPVELPPDHERAGDAWIVPLPIVAGRASRLELQERRAVPGTIDLLRDLSTDVEPFLRGSELPEPIARGLREVLAARVAIVERAARERALRVELGDLGQRNAEVRASLESLGARRDADGRALRTELAARGWKKACAASKRWPAISRPYARNARPRSRRCARRSASSRGRWSDSSAPRSRAADVHITSNDRIPGMDGVAQGHSAASRLAAQSRTSSAPKSSTTERPTGGIGPGKSPGTACMRRTITDASG
jgi:hypothetical protein